MRFYREKLTLTVNTSSLNFPVTLINDSNNLNLVLSSSAGKNLETITISDDSNQFSFSPITFELSDNAPQNITITFSPSSIGSLSGTLTISSSAGDVKNVPLTGSGAGFINNSILFGSLATGSSDNFGNSVAMNSAGDRLIVGAANDEINNVTSSTGIAYIFTSGSIGWNQEAILTGSLAIQSSDNFGSSVTMNSLGNRVIVTAKKDEYEKITVPSGSTYVFRLLDSFGDGWSGNASIQLRDSGNNIIQNFNSSSIPSPNSSQNIFVTLIEGQSYNLYFSNYDFLSEMGIQIIDPNATSQYLLTPPLSSSLVGTVLTTWTAITGSGGIFTSSLFLDADRGIGYVFTSGAYGWIQEDILVGSLSDRSDLFGDSVTINSLGNKIAVSAIDDEVNIGSQGLVYIFNSSSIGWIEESIITGSFAIQTSDNFGNMIKFNSNGEYLIVGARNDESSVVSSSLSNSTYTFKLTDSFGDGWNNAQMQLRIGTTVVQTLNSPAVFTAGTSYNIPITLISGTTYNLFYNATGSYPSEVGIQIIQPNGTTLYTLAAGAGTINTILTTWTADAQISSSVLTSPSSGLAYIFKSGSNGWNQESILSGSLATDSDEQFGYSVGMNSAGDRVVVGAINDERISGSLSEGLVYVFISASNGWNQESILSGSLAIHSNDNFGNSVAMNSAGDRIIVGAYNDEPSGSSSGNGVCYLFVSGSNGWFQQSIFSSSLAISSEDFGNSVAINSAGNRILITSPLEERPIITSGSGEGLVYIFEQDTNLQIPIIINYSSSINSINFGNLIDDKLPIISSSNFIVSSQSSSYTYDASVASVSVDISSSLSGVFSITPLTFNIAKGFGGSNENIIINYSPTSSGNHFGIVTLSSSVGNKTIPVTASVQITQYIQDSVLSGSVAFNNTDQFGNSVAMNFSGNCVVVGSINDEVQIPQTLSAGSTYIFKLLDAYGDGWNSAAMQLRDNLNNVVQTITMSVSSISQIITSSLTPGQSYNLYWNTSGSFPNEVGIQIIDPNANIQYYLPISSSSSVGTVLTTWTAITGSGGTYYIDGSGSSGNVYVFSSGSNGWSQQTILSGSLATGSSDQFGSSVAINSIGDCIVVGVIADEINGAITSTGLAYIFNSSSNGWVQNSILSGSLATGSGDNFGNSVSINSAGDRIIVGAINDERISGSLSEGLVYVFISGSTGWIQEAILSGSLATGSSDNFGYSVAMNSAGDSVIVGVISDERASQSSTYNEGLAYIFKSGSTGWVQESILSGSLATGSSDNFGYSVAMNSTGDRVVVGAINDERASLSTLQNEGLVYIFVSGSSGWTQQTVLSGSLAVQSSDNFGNSVSINSAGDRIIVGAYNDESGVATSTGLVYIFTSGTNGWSERQIVSGSFAVQSNDNFGNRVAMNSTGDSFIAGAINDEAFNISSYNASGVAYIFNKKLV